jgi:hypothetical protein
MALFKFSKIKLNIKLLTLTLFLTLSSTALHTFLVETDGFVSEDMTLKGQVLQAVSCNHIVISDTELETANESVQAGETVCLYAGTYTTPINPSNSGSPEEGDITYQAVSGETPIITARSYLDNKSYLVIEGIKFESDGHTWISTNSNSHNIQLLECEFDSSEAGSYNGIYIRNSSYITIRDSIFGKRWHGNIISVYGGSYLLIENNDFSQAYGEHGLINISASNLVIRGNYFRNPWDRALSVRWKGNDEARNVLIENNIFFDNNWNRIDFNPSTGSAKGTDQIMKFSVSKGILRNNLMVGSNKGKNYEYSPVIHLTTYGEVYRYEHSRIYHNTLYKNEATAITISWNKDLPLYAEDNIFKNNIFSEHNLRDEYDDRVLKMSGSIPNERTFHFIRNIMSDTKKAEVVSFHGLRTVQSAEQDYPDMFMDNIIDHPVFTNPSILEQAKADSTRNTRVSWEDFFLLGSTGKGEGAYLTEATLSSTSPTTTVHVDDALYFSDGMEMIAGDRIIIGSNDPVTVEDVVDETTLRVDRAIDVSAGDKIYLEAAGTSPDIGVYSGQVVPTPTPTPTPTPPPPIPGDLDGDRDVDIFDLIIVGSRFGEDVGVPCIYDPCPDADGDGDVDIFDLITVGSHFGEGDGMNSFQNSTDISLNSFGV